MIALRPDSPMSSPAWYVVHRSESVSSASAKRGLPPSRRARWKHDARSAEVAALRRAARAQLRRVRAILSRTHISAGHGVHRTKSLSATGKPAPKNQPQRTQRSQSRCVFSARSAESLFLCALCVLCGEFFLSRRWAWGPSSGFEAKSRRRFIRVPLRPNPLLPLGMGCFVRFATSCAHRPPSAPSGLC